MIGRIFAVQLDQSPQTAYGLPFGRFILNARKWCQVMSSQWKNILHVQTLCKQILGSFKQSRIYDISLAAHAFGLQVFCQLVLNQSWNSVQKCTLLILRSGSTVGFEEVFVTTQNTTAKDINSAIAQGPADQV